MSAYSMGPHNGYVESLNVWSLRDGPVYTGTAKGIRATSMAAGLTKNMRQAWPIEAAIREISQNMFDACVMSVSHRFLDNLSSSSSSGILWKAVPLDGDVRGWKLYMNGVYAAEVCGWIEPQKKDSQEFVAKVMFYNRGRAIPASFFVPKTDKDQVSSSIQEFLVGGFGQGEVSNYVLQCAHCVSDHPSIFRVEGCHRHADGRGCNELPPH